MMGSDERFKNIVTRLNAPDSSKLLRKYSATSFVTPMAQNTTPKLSVESSLSWAWRTICAASWLWLMPEPEKMGSFCPRISVMSVSIEEMPVRI